MPTLEGTKHKKRKTANFHKLVAGRSQVKKLRPRLDTSLTVLNSLWPFVIITNSSQRALRGNGYWFWTGRHLLFNSTRALCRKGFAKWESHDAFTSRYLSNFLNEIFPGDLTTLIMSYVKNLRPQISKDRNETLALSIEEKARIPGFAKLKQWDTLSIFCLVLSTSFYNCFVSRLLKHFFFAYSLQEQLLVAVGLVFTSSPSSKSGTFSNSQKRNFGIKICRLCFALCGNLQRKNEKPTLEHRFDS